MTDSSRLLDPAPALPAWTFFRQWLRNPLATAALSPSGQQLARAMMAELPYGTRRVVELGAGTGVFTEALLREGIAARDLLVLELNPSLYDLLRRRFPTVNVVHGNAAELAPILAASSLAGNGTIDAVVSGLGFLAMPRALQARILRGVFEALRPGCPLIQFTYGPRNPLPRDLLAELGIGVRRAGIAWANVPPAVVYVYSRPAGD